MRRTHLGFDFCSSPAHVFFLVVFVRDFFRVVILMFGFDLVFRLGLLSLPLASLVGGSTGLFFGNIQTGKHPNGARSAKPSYKCETTNHQTQGEI